MAMLFFTASALHGVKLDAVHLTVVVDVHDGGAIAGNLLVFDAGGPEAISRNASAHVGRLTSGARLRLGFHVGVLHLVACGRVEVLVVPVGVLLPVDNGVIDPTGRPVCVNSRGALELRICRHFIATGSSGKPTVKIEAGAGGNGRAVDSAVFTHLRRGNGSAALGIERHPGAVSHNGRGLYVVVDDRLFGQLFAVNLPSDQLLAGRNLILGARRRKLGGRQRLSLDYLLSGNNNIIALALEGHSACLSKLSGGGDHHVIFIPSLVSRHYHFVKSVNKPGGLELPSRELLAIGISDKGKLNCFPIGQELGVGERDGTHLKLDLHHRVAVDAARLIGLIGRLNLKGRRLLFRRRRLSVRLRWRINLGGIARDGLLVLELRHGADDGEGVGHPIALQDVVAVRFWREYDVLVADGRGDLHLGALRGLHRELEVLAKGRDQIGAIAIFGSLVDDRGISELKLNLDLGRYGFLLDGGLLLLLGGGGGYHLLRGLLRFRAVGLVLGLRLGLVDILQRGDDLGVVSLGGGVGARVVREHGHVQEREHQKHRQQD